MNKLKKIPNFAHFAIVTEEYYIDPGDPDDGFAPEERVYYSKYTPYTDKASWMDEVRRLTEQKVKFTALWVKVAEVETVVNVNVRV